MYKKISKFLKIFFMCHCRADRSFFFKGKQFPICARCTGQLIGLILGIIIAFKIKDLSWFYIVLLMLPLIIDGVTQLLTKYESNNIKRVITGILFGIGFIFLFLKFHYFILNLALKTIKHFWPNHPAITKYKMYIK